MKVLQVCKKSPTPQRDGESIAIHQITKALIAQGNTVDVFAMLTTKHPSYDSKSELEGVNYEYLAIDTAIHLKDGLFSIFGSIPYIVKRFESNAFESALIKKLQATEYDVIIFEGIFLSLYLDTIKNYSSAKLVLRAHNIENQIWKRQAKLEVNYLKKAFLNLVMNRQFEKFELQMIQKYNGILSISPLDNQYFVKNEVKKTLITPVCMDVAEKSSLPEGFQVGFLGGMDWAPNLQGVIWFVEEVWLNFVKTHPEARFNLAGRNFPKDLKSLQYPGLKIHGEIEDAEQFIKRQSLIIAPIFSGSGMRVKIIEAMSYGKCVLSTSMGAEGIQYEDKVNILIADSAAAQLEILNSLFCERAALRSIGEQAVQLVEKEYSLKEHAKKMHVFLQEL